MCMMRSDSKHRLSWRWNLNWWRSFCPAHGTMLTDTRRQLKDFSDLRGQR